MVFWIIVLLFTIVPISRAENEVDLYKYTAEVKAEVYEPIRFESSSKVNANLHIQQESKESDSISYIIKLQNITVSEYNGRSKDKYLRTTTTYTPKGSEIIEKPFLVVYGEDGQFQGVKFLNDDASWSINVKLSIASALQYNGTIVKKGKSNISYFQNEYTIHGNCRVSNDFITKPKGNKKGKIIRLTKNYVPKYCSEYPRDIFDVSFDQCFKQLADDNISSVNKVYEIHVQGKSTKLMKYEGDEIETRMPYLHKSDGLVLRTKQTIVYEKSDAKRLSGSIFNEERLVQDVIYDKTTTYVADGARNDITQGRHDFGKGNVTKVIELLKASYDYMNSDRFIKQDPDIKNSNNINKIFDSLLFFDYNSTKVLWNELNDQEKTDKNIFIRKIYLDILCYVGTDASAATIRDAIRFGEITDTEAFDVLSKFPQYVLEPKEDILEAMEILLHLDEKISHDVKKAGILGFASLVYRIYEDHSDVTIPERLEKYLQYFNNKLQDAIKAQDNEMILVYIMVFQNIKIGNIERFLWPILRKEVKIQNDGDRIRVATAFALFGGISSNHELVHNVYFPIFSDESEYMPLRTASFLRLMYVTQLENQTRPMEMYWQYTAQKNPLIRNLLSSNILTHANFGTTCRQTIREMYEKIVKFAELKKVNFSIPSVSFIDYSINKYAFGEAMIQYILKINENTGLADIGAFIYNVADGRKPGPFIQFYWMFDDLENIILDGLKYFLNEDPDIKKLITEYESKSSTNSTLAIIPFYGFQATQVYYYDTNSLEDYKEQFWQQIFNTMNFTTIYYSKFKESTAGTDIGVPNYFHHHEPTLFSFKVYSNAKLEDKTVNVKLNLKFNTWADNSYDLSIYNSLADTFHQVRRSTYVDTMLPISFELSYNVETKTLQISVSETTDTDEFRTKLSTYSKVYSTLYSSNSDECQPLCSKTVTKGKNARKEFQSAFESNLTSIKYNLDIYDCETGFSPDVDEQEWLDAVNNPDRNNLFGPTFEDFLVAKQKLVEDMMSARPGICGMIKEFLPINGNLSFVVKLKSD
ncbi:uncharacterized protein LOC100677991 [Nasonia vitripennis]|uniref:Vitellogenin domain-containing protein n=1 Tax=Nasonia vitripennis TaxID=7425 RepID=A0A7M7M780_NASVI|nr:uncharacterized protein LOC100677991 [Nasonia vitripennis]